VRLVIDKDGNPKPASQAVQRLAREIVERSGANSVEHFNRVVFGEVSFRDQTKEYLRWAGSRGRKRIKDLVSVEGALNKWILCCADEGVVALGIELRIRQHAADRSMCMGLSNQGRRVGTIIPRRLPCRLGQDAATVSRSNSWRGTSVTFLPQLRRGRMGHAASKTM
jgi:hypothetical protein